MAKTSDFYFDPVTHPFCFKGHKYALDVVSGKIPNCSYIIGACKRYLKDLENKKWIFDKEKAERFLRLAQKFDHVKGNWKTPNVEFEPWQCWVFMNIFGFINPETGYRRFRTAHIEVPRGHGKAHPLDEVVPTPDGIKKWGDLSIGDRLYSRNGDICTIVNKTPISDQKLFIVKFSDGSEVRCSGQHEWVTTDCTEKDRKNRHRKNPPTRMRLDGTTMGNLTYESVKETIQIKNTLTVSNGTNHSVVNTSPVKGEIPNITGFPAYFLGYWLGNGYYKRPDVTCSFQDLETLIRKFKNDGLEIGSLYRKIGSNGVLVRVLNKYKEIKFLYDGKRKLFRGEWLNWSIDNRLELLRGLLDSDGYCAPDGTVYFYNSDEDIIKGTYRLICSLGYRATIGEKHVSKNNNYKSSRKHYVITFSPRGNTKVFNLPRKYLNQKELLGNHTYATKRYIVDVIETDIHVPMFCVEVDSADHTYLISESYIPTHNSAVASIVALYILALDNPKGNEISCFATKSDQARIVLDSSRVMAKENKGFLKNTGTRVLAHQIKHEKSNSIMKARSSKSGSLDGLNDILSIIDELHAVSRELFDVIISGLKKRTDSLLLCITTAGFNTDSVGHDQSQYARQVSTGKTQDDTFFGVVYTIDQGDDIYNVETWKKANPNWGISVDPVNFEAYANKTKVTPADLPNFKVKHLNMWLSEAKAYYDLSKWDACADEDLRLEDFFGQPCNVGIDLASKIDLTAIVYVFRDKDGVYTIFDRCYIPQQTVDEAGNTLYIDSISKGHLIATPGEAIHYPVIYEDLLSVAKNVRVQDALYDPWNATEFAQKLAADRINAVEFKMNTANFSEPTKALDALMRQGKIRHNGSKLLRWCIGNVVCKEDAAANVYPRKSHEKLKIDPAIALIMALASWIQKEQEESVYETRGIIVI